MQGASYDLYKELKPRTGAEKIAAMLIVSVSNASLDCLAQLHDRPPESLHSGTSIFGKA